jgi:hypothetical protein
MLPQNGGTNTQSLTTLSKVTVQHFTATPSAIGPFGESILRWSVTGPSVGWSLALNGAPVARVGSLLVEPPMSTGYALTARAGTYTRPLTSLVVSVDVSSCDVISGPSHLVLQIVNLVKTATLASDPTLYFREDPKVSFLPGRIHIEVKIGKPVPHFPNPEIDGTLEFGLDVANGTLVATNPTVDASVSEPWYVYLGGLDFLGLWIELSDAQETAQIGFEHLAQGLPPGIGFLYQPSPGHQYKSVAIVPDSTDNPIQITECAIPPR